MPIVNGVRYPFHSFQANMKGTLFVVEPHWHYYIELLYFLKGKADVIVGNKRYEVYQGDFVIINSREVHSIYSTYDAQTSYIVIKFDTDVLYTSAKAAFEAKYVLPFTLSQQDYQKLFTKAEFESSSISNLPLDLFKEYSEKNYGYELAVRMNIGRIFLWIIRKWEAKGLIINLENIPDEMDINKLQQLLDYLDVHYADKLNVEEMAKMCNLSYCYFSRYFRKVMGKTFTEHINYIRIIEAKRLLLTTEMNITEVALSTGFTSSSYFIEQFKRYSKESPKQFKKNALGKL